MEAFNNLGAYSRYAAPPTRYSDQELRLECARLCTLTGSFNGREAQALYDFVTGRSDLTPRQKIDAALAEMGDGVAK